MDKNRVRRREKEGQRQKGFQEASGHNKGLGIVT